MIQRLVLGALIFGWLGLFGFGLALGNARNWGWVYLLAGSVVGVLAATATRRWTLPRSVSERASTVAFLVALVFLVWGVVGLASGRDPVTGEATTSGVSSALAIFSAAPAAFGFFLLAMRRR